MIGAAHAFEVETGVLPCAHRRLPVHNRGLIVAVLLKQLLNTITAEEKRIFLDCILVLPVVVIDMFLVEVVFLMRGDIRCIYFMILETLP